MTEAMFAWQAIIFVSIGLSGSRRWWVVAAWLLWTSIQVMAIPLTALQFATIGLSAWVFSRKRSVPDSSDGAATSAESQQPPTEPASDPIAARPQSNLGQSLGWAADLEQRTREMSRRQDIRRAAAKSIKTSGFSSESEEQVMTEALERDQDLTRQLQAHLAEDSVLRDLFNRALERTRSISSEGVAARQMAEKHALRVARERRSHLDAMFDKDESGRNRYFDALTKGKQTLAEEGHGTDDEPHQVLGRPYQEWFEDIRKLRASNSQVSAPLSSSTVSTLLESVMRAFPELASKASSEQQVLATGSVGSKATDERVASNSPPAKVAYITHATFSRLAKEWFHPSDISLDAIFDEIYNQSLSNLLNRREAAELYVRRLLLQGRVSDLTIGERKFSKKYIFSVGQSKFHASADCPYLLSEFRNYLVPIEIERLGPAKIREFQEFCDNNKNVLRDKTPEVFWAHVGAHFRLSIAPQPVLIPNSGTQHVESPTLEEIESRIDASIAEAKRMIDTEGDSHPITRMRYASSADRAVAQAQTSEDQALLSRFFELKKNLLTLLFEFYKREQGVSDIALPVELLLQAELGACKGCWRDPAKLPSTH